MPDLVATLRGKLAAWRSSVGAQTPMFNPVHTPADASQ